VPISITNKQIHTHTPFPF